MNRYNAVRQRPYSIRTRIKTPAEQAVQPAESEVRDHIPLEQGLRRLPKSW